MDHCGHALPRRLEGISHSEAVLMQRAWVSVGFQEEGLHLLEHLWEHGGSGLMIQKYFHLLRR